MTLATDQATRLRALVAEGVGEPRDQWPGPVAPVVAVASGKGGVGKTNLCVNLAVLLARRGVRTTLVDADTGVSNADVLCGLRPPRRLTADRSARDVAIAAPGGFVLVPGIQSDPDALHLVQRAIADAARWSDLVLADLPPGIGREVTRPALDADRLLVVTTPEPTAVTDGYALLKCLAAEATLEQRPFPSIALVVNQARGEGEAMEIYTRLRGACVRFLGIEPGLAGWVTRDERVREAVRAQEPLALRSPRARASRDLSRVADVVARDVRPRRGERATLAVRLCSWLVGR